MIFNVGKGLRPVLLGGQNRLAKLAETLLNQLLEVQVMETFGADRCERVMRILPDDESVLRLISPSLMGKHDFYGILWF